MATNIDICNLALSHLKDPFEISAIEPPDGSKQSKLCARYYPIARKEVLARHDWGFARRRQLLAAISGDAPSGWSYWYLQPNPIIQARKVVVDGFDTPQGFVQESHITHGTIILTEASPAELWYTTDITDTSKFPPMFVHATSWLLASYLVGPLSAKADLQKATIERFEFLLGQAATADANSRKDSKSVLNLKTFKPAGIRARA